MGFIKKNAFLLSCALGGIVGLGLMVWGMTGMSKVSAEMSNAQRLHVELDREAKTLVQPEAIEAQRERILKVREHHGEVMAHFAERCKRTPLVEDLLPDPGKGPTGKNLRYEFRSKYQRAMRGLLVRLNAGQAPTKEEIDDTADYLKKKAMEEGRFTAQAGQPDDERGRAGRGGEPNPRGAGSSKDGDMPERDGPASTKAYWKALEERAENDAVMLAGISNARKAYCYANVGPGGSFELHGMYLATDDSAPGMRDIWDAQLWHWIQADVVEALAVVNDRAAAKLENPWVGNLPIKDLRSIRVSDYIVDTGDAPPAAGRGSTAELPISHPHDAYTHLSSDPLYDVVNLRLRTVVDVRDLPEILDELCHDRYYNILKVAYTAISPDLAYTGKIYGPEPIVLATIDLQTYMYYKSYVPMMPATVREQLGISEQDFEKLVEELQPAEEGDSGEAEQDEG